MPTALPPTSPYATLTASQAVARSAEAIARYRREDAERALRRAAILAL